MDLFQQQASNRRRTWLVMAVFVLFFCGLGYGFDVLYLGTTVPAAALIALAGGSAGAYASYRAGDRAVLASAQAVALEQLQATASSADDRLKYRQFENVVEEMAIAAGLPRPRLYVIPDSDPNAFATGRDPEHASIAVTRGLLDSLDREELQAVVAHELGHIRNFDIRLMTVVAALVGAVALLADFARRGMGWGGNRRSSRGRSGGAAGAILLVVWLAAVILAPIVGRLLAALVSRQREYLADASAAELTRNPLGLARALEKIENAVESTPTIKRGTANLCIVDPLGRPITQREGWLAELFATHPPMARRIAALRAMAYEGAVS